MEGYLHKKAREQSFFSSKNWKKRYFTMDGAYITSYEFFDLTSKKPLRKKGVYPLDGCECVEEHYSDREFGFSLKHATRKPLFLSSETQDEKIAWMRMLNRAINGELGSSTMDLSEYYTILELNKSEELSTSVLNKQFRKLAMKEKREGSTEKLNAIQQAYEILLAKVESDKKANSLLSIDFEAVVEKCGAGIGLGIVVIEELSSEPKLLVAKVLPKVKLIACRSAWWEGDGPIFEGDRLVAIEGEDCSNWPLVRISQRISDTRIPIGSYVHLKFSRLIHKDLVDGSNTQDNVSPQDNASTQDESSLKSNQLVFSGQKESCAVSALIEEQATLKATLIVLQNKAKKLEQATAESSKLLKQITTENQELKSQLLELSPDVFANEQDLILSNNYLVDISNEVRRSSESLAPTSTKEKEFVEGLPEVQKSALLAGIRVIRWNTEYTEKFTNEVRAL